MKKLMVLIFAMACMLGMVSCASKTDKAADIPKPSGSADCTAGIPKLSEVADYTQEQLDEKLLGLSEESMHNSWGEPDSVLSGLWGDIWSLDAESDKTVVLYYDKDGIVERVVCSLPDEKVVSNEALWAFTSTSARLPAMSFSFDVSYQEIMAVCDNGTLVGFDNFDDISQSYPEGKSLTIPNDKKLYWAPWVEDEDTLATSAKVTFTVLGKDGEVLYKGILSIERTEETDFGAIYSATLEDCNGLTLTQDEWQSGGILTPLSN